MEYMPLLLRQFLGGRAPDLPNNEFKAYVLALAHIYENEAPVSDRVMERHMTVKGWRNAKAGLIAKGRLFEVQGGGVMDEVALDVLRDYHQQQLAASERGRRAGLISASKRRNTTKRAAATGDLFANRLQATSTAEKANEFNDSGQQGVNHRAPAHARKRDETELHPGCIPVANELQHGLTNEKPSKINTRAEHTVNQREREEEREYSPVSPHSEIELVEGTVEGDEFAVPRRKPGRPIPGDWTPESAQLSEAVANMVAEWDAGEFERESAKFVEDAHSNDRRHRNWDRAFGVWLTKHDGYLEERRKRNERPSGWAKAGRT